MATFGKLFNAHLRAQFYSARCLGAMMDPCHGSGNRIRFGCGRKPGTAFSLECGREFKSRRAHHFFSFVNHFVMTRKAESNRGR